MVVLRLVVDDCYAEDGAGGSDEEEPEGWEGSFEHGYVYNEDIK